MTPQVIAVVGATATGKSDLALDLAAAVRRKHSQQRSLLVFFYLRHLRAGALELEEAVRARAMGRQA